MDNYFGNEYTNTTNTGGSSSSSSLSKKLGSKKSNVVSKPKKQPQRGLGVAQLEKIRILHNHQLHHPPPPSHSHFNVDDPRLQMPSSYSLSYAFQPYNMMGLQPEYGGNVMMILDNNPQRNMITTQPFLNLYESSSQDNNIVDMKKHRSDDTQELDLELRLSHYS